MAEKRLIDAWSLIEWLQNIDTENHLRVLRGKKAKFLTTDGVRHMVDTIPTEDAELVVHGRWVIHSTGHGVYANNWAECSECGTCGSPQWKRCPVCEAKMDKEDNNGNET